MFPKTFFLCFLLQPLHQLTDSVDQHAINLSNLTLPDSCTSHTPLLELQPLEKTVLNNPVYESLYKFSHFNPVQTQIFHCLYHTDNNVLLGAPTGSGKTIAAEICIFRLLNMQPHLKVGPVHNILFSIFVFSFKSKLCWRSKNFIYISLFSVINYYCLNLLYTHIHIFFIGGVLLKSIL